MPGGKRSKQQRRAGKVPASPPVRSKGGRGERRQASPKVLVAAGVMLVAAAVAIVLVATLGGGSSNAFADLPAVGSLSGALPGAADIETLFKGIPQQGTTLGRSSAPVTMVEFIDPQCPYCREFETTVLPSLVQTYVRNGRLRIQMEPWAFIGPDSVRGQAAELAAAQQNKAFDYAELLYFNQGVENTGWLNDSMVAAAARSIPGLRVHTFLNTRSSGEVSTAQKQVDDLALADHITGTPSLYIGKTGTKGAYVNLSSPTDKAAVVAAIANAA